MSKITINVNGREIRAKEGDTILKAALDGGVYIPNLCYHPDLEPLGACRLCVVEIEGRSGIFSSCTTLAEDGMRVNSETEITKKIRRQSMELMLQDHPSDCSTCPKYGSCPMQSMIQYLEVTNASMRVVPQGLPEDTGNPLFIRDSNRCIRCGRCVRACRELRQCKAIDYVINERGNVVIKNSLALAPADQCKYCCACVEVCPTGALRDKEETLTPDKVLREDRFIPCRATCPAHTDVPRYIRYVKEGRYDDAAAVIREKVPFPGILGYVCDHSCELACRRKYVNEAVSIRNIKRFAYENSGDAWKSRRRINPPTGKKAAVIGGGPAGLTAAYYLAKQGHAVTVYEAYPEAGGMARYGIPEYRLPRDVIRKEIDTVREVGVEIRAGERVTDIAGLKRQGYDAVLLAIGTHSGVRLPLEGSNLEGVILNVDFLRAARLDEPISVGKRVVILGGGNVAFDCARTALRQGAQEVHIACLETRENMTAGEDEIAEGLEEGIILHPASSFVKIEGIQHVSGMAIEKVASFTFDENHQAMIETVPDSKEVIEADNIIFAVGQKPENAEKFGVDLFRNSYFVVDQDMKCNVDGVFAAGDAVYGTKSVVQAIASGREAAAAIDRYLGGDGDISENLVDKEKQSPILGEHPGFGSLRREYPILECPADRVKDCMLVEHTFDKEKADAEANRCLQCNLRAEIQQERLWSSFENKEVSG